MHIMCIWFMVTQIILWQFYMKTGTCKFGATCKFHHPRDIQLPSPTQKNGSVGKLGSANYEMTEDVNLVKPLSVAALLHNSKGLPIRPVFYRFCLLPLEELLYASFVLCLLFWFVFFYYPFLLFCDRIAVNRQLFWSTLFDNY